MPDINNIWKDAGKAQATTLQNIDYKVHSVWAWIVKIFSLVLMLSHFIQSKASQIFISMSSLFSKLLTQTPVWLE